jgi:hypothetical protein
MTLSFLIYFHNGVYDIQILPIKRIKYINHVLNIKACFKCMICVAVFSNVFENRQPLGTDHLTWKGRGGYGFLFRSEFFFRTTQELEFYFFCREKRTFFSQNLTLGYMTKTLNQIILFPPPKSEYFFQQHWESEYFF